MKIIYLLAKGVSQLDASINPFHLNGDSEMGRSD
jgi:hypothetical protein